MADNVQFTLSRTKLSDPENWTRSSFIMKVTCSFAMEGVATFIDEKIFLFRRVGLANTAVRESGLAAPTPSSHDVFVGICSVKDMQTWGTDPDADVTFYRNSEVELVFRHPDHMDEAWSRIYADVEALRVQLEAFSDLEESETESYNGDTTYILQGSSSSSGSPAGYLLTRSGLATYPSSNASQWRLTITCQGLGGWQSEIFKHLRQFPNMLTDVVVDRPMGVASPTDLEEFPKDVPDDVHFPRFFLKSTLDVVSKNLSLLEEVWDLAIKEVRMLQRSLTTMVETEDEEAFELGTLPPTSSSSSSVFQTILASSSSSSTGSN